MPPRKESDQPDNGGTAIEPYTMPQHIREELLRAQQGSIQTALQLPKIKIMPAGAGLYEIEGADDGSQRTTTERFTGVILNSHWRNVLWDRKFGGPAPADDALRFPACSSPDGKWGVPREGFMHAMLGGKAATGEEHIECATCHYNQWKTGAELISTANAKGKAVTNQRALYIMVPNRNVPMEMILSPMSIPPFDEYLMGLLNQSIPVQGVVTEFTQKVVQRSTAVAMAQFKRVGFLDEEQFSDVLRKREEFKASINPPAEYIPAEVHGDVSGQEDADDDEHLPF